MLISDHDLEYIDWKRAHGICNVRIYRRPKAIVLSDPGIAPLIPVGPGPDLYIIVLSELASNVGPSVTNTLEQIATTVAYRRDLLDLPEDLDPLHYPHFDTVFVEKSAYEEEEPDAVFSRVTFGQLAWVNDRHEWRDPRWERLPRSTFLALIDQEDFYIEDAFK